MQPKTRSNILLSAYAQGLFPMAEGADNAEINWYCPQKRGQLSIQDMHVPKRLKKNLRQMKINGSPYTIRINHNFTAVMEACAQETQARKETWINQTLIDAYTELHEDGHAHSVECWQDDNLVGGLYGVSLGAAFFGESMFSSARDASKVSLIHLAARLKHAGYVILDTQFTNDHLKQFGVFEVEHDIYLTQLEEAINISCQFKEQDISEQDLIKCYLS